MNGSTPDSTLQLKQVPPKKHSPVGSTSPTAAVIGLLIQNRPVVGYRAHSLPVALTNISIDTADNI